jgi:hypothetical protein
MMREHIARAHVAAQPQQLAEQPVFEHDGVPRLAAVARAHRRRVPARRDHAVDGAGRWAGLVAQEHHRRLGVPGRAHAGTQRRRLPLLPALGDGDLGAPELHRGTDLLGLVAEHDDHAIEPSLRVGRVDRMLQQRAAVEVGELLGPAEPAPGAGREHDPDDQVSSPPSRRSASSSSDASELPARKWSACGRAALIPRVSGS